MGGYLPPRLPDEGLCEQDQDGSDHPDRFCSDRIYGPAHVRRLPNDQSRGWPTFFKYLGPLAILGLCYSQFLALKKFFSPLPLIEIDSKGVTINQPYYGFMPWSNITRVHLVQRQVSLTNKIRLLIFEPRDIAEFLAPFKGYALTRVRTGMEQYGGAMMLLGGLPMNPDEFCNAAIEYSQQEIAANVLAPPPA